jgi:excisionase family DNA binding protein
MDTMLTLGAAARQLGVSKGTISKAIASGKLSATRREDGSWQSTAPNWPDIWK